MAVNRQVQATQRTLDSFFFGIVSHVLAFRSRRVAGETERFVAVHAHRGRGGAGGPIRSGGGFERGGARAKVRQALQQVAADGGHMEQGEK